ncbi:MAG: glutathione S-transferase, partial [Mycobacteriaceae bacterium]|nr:glutathione S-transferase [Mycobacteriaceae bacterium]
YHLPNGPARSVKPLVVLEELNIPFNIHPVNILAGEQKSAEFLALNPLGKIPVLKVEVSGQPDQVLIESAAIIYYLLDNFDPEHKLTGAIGSTTRSVFHQVAGISVWAEEPLWRAFDEAFFKGGFEGEEGKGDKAVYDAAIAEFQKSVEPVLELLLADKPFFGGDSFGAADALAGFI